MSTLTGFDRYWDSLLYLFKNHPKLSQYLTSKYIDITGATVHVRKLRESAKAWSSSEKFILDLALHLFNPSNKVDMSGMDRLDDKNKKLAFDALQIRFLRR
ncbi:hypothetical protein [Paenibacillus sp. OAE614]|uniref:hypothetical protein n=1 Tax=Paenibacillus sp. OAE614 TaxID=2663804 RepID=UPI001789D463